MPKYSEITGTGTYYASGATGTYNGAAFGADLFSAGGGAAPAGAAPTAVANKGGGGSANMGSGSAGSGVVIIAYPSTQADITTIGGGLTYTKDTSTRSGWTVYKFTAGTGTVTI
jgi:hypothetical protein